jgi:hypothetical protein
MTKTIWRFSVTYDGINTLSPRSNGIFASSIQDVEKLGSVSGLPVLSGIRRGKEYRKISVEFLESDPALQAILDEIFKMYSFKPSKRRIIPEAERSTNFGVRRDRQYCACDLADSRLLMLQPEHAIAIGGGRSSEEITAEKYVVKNYRPKKAILLGVLAPFSAISVDEELKLLLDKSQLKGLKFDQVHGALNLWKLGSSVTMPRSSVPLVNAKGRQVSPTDSWSDCDERWFDDGFTEAELVYSERLLCSLPDFDIAMTAERIGQHNAGAYRRCIVSQNFRMTLDNLKVPGVRYTPVRIEVDTDDHT